MAAGLRSLGTWTSTLRGRDQYRRVPNTTARLTTEVIRCTRQTNWRDCKIRPKLSLPRSYDPTYTSKTHLTNTNTETSAARLAALGEPIDYDYDYRSECNEQTRNHRGA